MEEIEVSVLADDNLSLFDDLDGNGFPAAPPSDDDDEEQGGKGIPRLIKEQSNVAAAGSFASDFYSSGTDWSCLVEEEASGKERKSLVQRDLFQMWGIKKKTISEETRPRVPSPPHKKQRAARDGSDDKVSHPKSGGSGSERPRACPFYKKIPGTPFTVDAFRYGSIEGCLAYFLSHFHYDHYGGLSKRWSHGPIYCTPLTARLLKMCLVVNSLYICPLELDIEHVIEGIKVTMLEANHCPGAALLHFRLKDGQCYLHTGDFRACKIMQSHSLLVNQRINALYLDTTYCNPKYRFPPKEDVVDFVVKTTLNFLAKQPKTLIVVGAYSIGKEQVYIAISQALGVPIFTNASRRKILQSFGWPELSGKLSSCGQSSLLHVLPLSFVRHDNLKEYVKTYKKQFTTVLAFRPTGWTYSETTGNQLDLIRPNCKGNITIYGVPYSEHSSFTELKEFVKFLRPDKIIPTVNVGNAVNRDKMQSYFHDWMKA